MVLRGQNNELLPWPPKSPNQSSQCTGLTGPGHEGPKSQNRGVKYPIKASEVQWSPRLRWSYTKYRWGKWRVKRSCALYKEGGKEVKKVTWMDQEGDHQGTARVRASGEARLRWSSGGQWPCWGWRRPAGNWEDDQRREMWRHEAREEEEGGKFTQATAERRPTQYVAWLLSFVHYNLGAVTLK